MRMCFLPSIRMGALFFVASSLLTSCHVSKVALDGRRPEVLANAYSCVLDYNDCLVDPCSSSDQEHFLEGAGELKEEYFDPYFPLSREFRLIEGDILEVALMGEEEVTVDNAVVAPDGNLYYTVVDGIPASGLTIQEVSDHLKEKLSDLFVDPVVSIAPKVIKGQSFEVLGRVQTPGQYSISSPIRLREAIAEAGGFLMNDVEDDEGRGRGNTRESLADLKASFLVRDNQKLKINFETLMNEGDNSQNIFMRPRDYVFIAPTHYPEIFVLGQAFNPQRVTYTDGMTLMALLSQVGGWTMGGPYSADMSKVLVIRGSLESPRVAQVDLKKVLYGEARDVYLQPGDIVYVQNKEFRFLRELVRVAIDSFIYSFATSAGSYYGGQVWFQGKDRALGN